MADRRVADLLNSCRGLPHQDQRELNDLVEEYFVYGQESEVDDSDESLSCDSDSSDDGFGDQSDQPLVNVPGALIQELEDHEPDELARIATTRSCKANGAGCRQIKVLTRDDGRQGCITQFDVEEIVALQLSLKDMDRDAKDLMILGILSCCMRNGPKTANSRRKQQTDRLRPRSSYFLLNRPVCKDAFLFLLGYVFDFLN